MVGFHAAVPFFLGVGWYKFQDHMLLFGALASGGGGLFQVYKDTGGEVLRLLVYA